jgi:hypothetical protein
VSAAVIQLQPRPAGPHAFAREPLDEAVGEVSARLASNNAERRRLYARLDELRAGGPALRRSGPRPLLADPDRPLTIYSIEEAGPGPSARRGCRA